MIYVTCFLNKWQRKIKKKLIASYSQIAIETNLKVVYNYREIDLILRVCSCLAIFVETEVPQWKPSFIYQHITCTRQHVCTVCRRGIDTIPPISLLIIDTLAYLLYIDGSRLSKDRAYVRVPFAFLDFLSIMHSFLFEEFEESSDSKSYVFGIIIKVILLIIFEVINFCLQLNKRLIK